MIKFYDALILLYLFHLVILNLIARSIYLVHDEIKDKLFEVELSWVGKGLLLKTVTILIFCLGIVNH